MQQSEYCNDQQHYSFINFHTSYHVLQKREKLQMKNLFESYVNSLKVQMLLLYPNVIYLNLEKFFKQARLAICQRQHHTRWGDIINLGTIKYNNRV